MSAACRRRRSPRTATTSSASTSTPTRSRAVNAGRSPIVEPGLDDLLAQRVAERRLRATTDTADAIASSEVSLLCVGTPSRKNGSLDLTYLERVCEQIGAALRDKPAITSSSSAARCCRARRTTWSSRRSSATSGKKYGDGFGVSVNPEFLREGTALKDFRKPPLTLVGHNHAADASGTIALYQAIDAPLVSTSIRVAEMIEVHEQHLARAEGVLRQRDRQPVQADRASTATRSWTSSAATRS